MEKKLPDGIIGIKLALTNKIPESWNKLFSLRNDFIDNLRDIKMKIKKDKYPNKPVSDKNS